MLRNSYNIPYYIRVIPAIFCRFLRGLAKKFKFCEQRNPLPSNNLGKHKPEVIYITPVTPEVCKTSTPGSNPGGASRTQALEKSRACVISKRPFFGAQKRPYYIDYYIRYYIGPLKPACL